MADETGADEKLLECESVMRERDAVMEPGIYQTLQHYVKAGGKPKAAIEHLSESYRGYARMASLVCRWLDMAKAARGKEKKDEVIFLGQLVERRFDSSANSVLRAAKGKPPVWIESLESKDRLRRLTFRLAEVHRHSSLIGYVLHNALKKGRKEELEQAPREGLLSVPAITTQFPIFCDLLEEKLNRICTSASAAERMEAIQGLCFLSQPSASTYVFAQLVLDELQRQGGDVHLRSAFRRASQELEQAAIQATVKDSALVDSFMPLLSHSTEFTVSVRVSSFLSHPSEGTLRELHSLFFSREGECLAPSGSAPEHALRVPRLLETLLSEVFTPERAKARGDRWRLAADLLSLASEGREEAKSAREDVERCVESLEEAGQAKLTGREEAGRRVARPVCALGSAEWVTESLSDPEHSTRVRRREATLCYACFLLESSRRHARARARVVKAIRSGIRAADQAGNEGKEMQRQLVEILAQILAAGAVWEALKYAQEWARTAPDTSLVRHFVAKVLDLCEPPFSDSFCSALVRILGASGLRHRRLEDRIASFLRDCTSGENQHLLGPSDHQLAASLLTSYK